MTWKIAVATGEPHLSSDFLFSHYRYVKGFDVGVKFYGVLIEVLLTASVTDAGNLIIRRR